VTWLAVGPDGLVLAAVQPPPAHARAAVPPVLALARSAAEPRRRHHGVPCGRSWARCLARRPARHHSRQVVARECRREHGQRRDHRCHGDRDPWAARCRSDHRGCRPHRTRRRTADTDCRGNGSTCRGTVLARRRTDQRSRHRTGSHWDSRSQAGIRSKSRRHTRSHNRCRNHSRSPGRPGQSGVRPAGSVPADERTPGQQRSLPMQQAPRPRPVLFLRFESSLQCTSEDSFLVPSLGKTASSE
jgi:hypothetical protein